MGIQRYNPLTNSLVFPVVLWVLAFGFSLSIGSSEYALGDIIAGAFHSMLQGDDLQNPSDLAVAGTIFWQARLPRTLLVCGVGALLAAAGVLSQGLFRNPLASPSVFGMEAGATLAGVIAMVALPSAVHWFGIPLFATVGALAVTCLLLSLSYKLDLGVGSLLLVGVALGSFLAAATSFIITLSIQDSTRTAILMRWLLGGFSGRGYEYLPMIVIPGILGVLVLGKSLAALDLLSLGETTAASLSVELKALKIRIVLVLGLWLGGAVAVAGTIPFVSLVVPHLSRIWFGPHHRRLLLGSMIQGMTLTLLADAVGRRIMAPAEIEVGIITSLLGAPLFLWILLKSGTWTSLREDRRA